MEKIYGGERGNPMSPGGWIVAAVALLFVILLQLRVGVLLDYKEKITAVTLCIGPWQKALSMQKNEDKKKTASSEQGSDHKKESGRKDLPLTKELIAEALQLGKRSMMMLKKRFRISPLYLQVTFGGSDPAEVAQTFGKANAVLWPVLSWLEATVAVRQREVRLDLAYDRPSTEVLAKVGISLRLGSLVGMALRLLPAMVQLLLHFSKEKKRKEEMRSDQSEKENAQPVLA